MDEALTRVFTATQIGETIADYPLADQPLNESERENARTRDIEDAFEDDRSFWWHLMSHEPSKRRTRVFRIDGAALCEWIARVPGLFWVPGSQLMRRIKPALIEEKTRNWITYQPLGKSQKVMGGIGTLKLPPAADGYRLMTLTTTLNASAGIPALVSPEIWEAGWCGEGSVTSATAKWQPMIETWAAQFPSVKGIPRGHLVLNQRSQVRVYGQEAPVQIHPFSIMQYWSGSAQLLDYVYASVDTAEPSFRSKLTEFFEDYRAAADRDGEYLLAADVSDPMWDAWFSSPAELRDSRRAPQLRLIEARVRDSVAGQDVVDALVRVLSESDDVKDLRRLSKDAGIEFQRWSAGGTVAEESARLVAEAVRSGKQQALGPSCNGRGGQI
jgi:hypothetical protein